MQQKPQTVPRTFATETNGDLLLSITGPAEGRFQNAQRRPKWTIAHMPYSEIVLSKDEADLHHEIDIAASMPFSIASQEGFYSLRAPDLVGHVLRSILKNFHSKHQILEIGSVKERIFGILHLCHAKRIYAIGLERLSRRTKKALAGRKQWDLLGL